MEQSEILIVENPIHIFLLHLVFTSGLNTALTEFANMINNHRLSTEQRWTPIQICLNGILNENNPLSSSSGVDESEVEEFYGEDPDAEHPHLLDDDGVVVAPFEVAHSMEITDFFIFSG